MAQLIVSISSINAAIEDRTYAVFALTVFNDTSSIIVVRTHRLANFYANRSTQGIYPTIIIILMHSDLAIINTYNMGITSFNIQLQDFSLHLDPTSDPILQNGSERKPISLALDVIVCNANISV